MIVILGSGLAGYSLLKELRKRGCERPVTVVTAEDGASYSKPMLSTGFAKQKEPAQLVMADAVAMAEQYQADIRAFTSADRIDPQAQTLWIGQECLPYEDLVLALGAAARDPGLIGNATDRVWSVNDLADYARVREHLIQPSRVLILGGGLIGCEFANDFVVGGHDVEIVTPAEQVLPSLLPNPLAHQLEQGLRAEGVRFSFKRRAQGVDYALAENGALRVSLDDGSVREVDAVISAIGLAPRIELASQAGLAVSQAGIAVDAYCRSSNPHIYALGDCAEIAGQNYQYVAPLMACAKALAKTLDGEPSAAQFPTMPIIVKTPSCPVLVAPPNTAGEWQVEEGGKEGLRMACVEPEGRLLGFALAGEAVKERQSWLKRLQAKSGGV